MNISQERQIRIQKNLKDNGIDVLFCRLSEHVLYFTGYWPRNHVGAAVVPAEGNPVLLLSEYEAEFELAANPPSIGVEVATFPLESADVMRGPNDGFKAVLPGVISRLGLKGKTIGIEESVEMCNVGTFQGEVKYPGKTTWDMLRVSLPGYALKDATTVIMGLREKKSLEEVEAIRLAIETAGFGIEAARNVIKPGMKEAELAAVVESAIHSRGTGYKGIKQARGYACVYAGNRSTIQWTHYAYSSDRIIRDGEPVIIELGSFADGYWSDLTRNIYLGTPPAQVQDYYEVICAAQKVAIDMMKPGVPFSALDRAVVQHLEKYGYEKYRTHGLGHGVGIAYHEGPAVHSANHALLEAGMVLTVEPGIYIEGLGGFRPEDMVWIREDGAELLSGIVPGGL